MGLGNTNANLTNFTGVDLNSIGWEWNTGFVYINGGHSNATFVTANARDVIAFAVDFQNSKFWVKNLTQGGGWNNDVLANQNPATNTGGYSIAGLNAGPYFIMASVGAAAGETVILNVGATVFVGALPVGFSAWGMSTTWNSSRIGSPATLTLPIAVDGGTYETWAAWQALGYDAHGINANPSFFDAVDNPTAATATNLRPVPGAAGVDAGTTLAIVTTDYLGTPRPQGPAFDIGAFELIPPVPERGKMLAAVAVVLHRHSINRR